MRHCEESNLRRIKTMPSLAPIRFASESRNGIDQQSNLLVLNISSYRCQEYQIDLPFHRSRVHDQDISPVYVLLHFCVCLFCFVFGFVVIVVVSSFPSPEKKRIKNRIKHSMLSITRADRKEGNNAKVTVFANIIPNVS